MADHFTGTGAMPAGSAAAYTATETVELLPGFRVGAGAAFSAAAGRLPAAVADEDWAYAYDAVGNLIKDAHGGIDNIEWTVYGKVARVAKQDGTAVEYRYDAMGADAQSNRVQKSVAANGATRTTHYVRDASGADAQSNLMATYEGLAIAERPIYGSSRPGGVPLGDYRGGTAPGTLALGRRRYELTNHLGNVLATVGDRAKYEDGERIAEVLSNSDYFPFGKQIAGRSFSTEDYRFGFQGQEGNPETGTVHFKYRESDPETGRFWSIDPLAAKYPHNSPYAFAENRLIDGVELEGLEWESYKNPGTQNTAASDNTGFRPTNGHVKTYHGGAPGAIGESPGWAKRQLYNFSGWLANSSPNIATIPLGMAYGIPNDLSKVLTQHSLTGAPVSGEAEYASALLNTGLNAFGGYSMIRNQLGKYALVRSVGAKGNGFIPLASEEIPIGLGLDHRLSSLRRFYINEGLVTYENGKFHEMGLTRVPGWKANSSFYDFKDYINESMQNASKIIFDVTDFNPNFNYLPHKNYYTKHEFEYITNNESILRKTTFIDLRKGQEKIWNGTNFIDKYSK